MASSLLKFRKGTQLVLATIDQLVLVLIYPEIEYTCCISYSKGRPFYSTVCTILKPRPTLYIVWNRMKLRFVIWFHCTHEYTDAHCFLYTIMWYRLFAGMCLEWVLEERSLQSQHSFFVFLFFSVRLLSVLRGHSFFFIPATTANDLRLRRIFYPRFYPLHLFSYLNSWERAIIFPLLNVQCWTRALPVPFL